MSVRSTIRWAGFLVLVTVVGIAGSLGYSVWLVAKSLSQIPATILAGFLEGMMSYLQMAIALEVVSTGIVIATQGSLPTLAWMASRLAVWQGN